MRRWLPEAEYRWINSPAFLRSPEWRDVRQDAIRLNDGACERCRRRFGRGVVLNVDHVRPRATHPHLALDRRNLQVICGPCNKFKGNRTVDYRSKNHKWRSPAWKKVLAALWQLFVNIHK